MGKDKKHHECRDCHQLMAPRQGCKFTHIVMKGVEYRRIKAGYAQDGIEKDELCHDCNVGYGQYHHYGCDIETCPVCQGQLISCDCSDIVFLHRYHCDKCHSDLINKDVL